VRGGTKALVVVVVVVVVVVSGWIPGEERSREMEDGHT
jgi:hypothetical protein